jgi:hypothetical protein
MFHHLREHVLGCAAVRRNEEILEVCASKDTELVEVPTTNFSGAMQTTQAAGNALQFMPRYRVISAKISRCFRL